METPKTPSFSAYDFLGYIVPGLAFLLLVDVTYIYHITRADIGYEYFCGRYGGMSWPGLIPLILFSYFVGHIISFVSSVTIEKHAIWTYGQPIKFMIYGYSPGYFCTNLSARPWVSKVMRFIMSMILLPIILFEIPLGKWAGLSGNYFKRADKLTEQAFKRAMVGIFTSIGIDVSEFKNLKPWDMDLENIAAHCALERAPVHVYTLRNYVVLYGFLRSMCLVLLLAFTVFWMHAFFYMLLPTAAFCFVVTSLMVFICYVAFLKFWCRYYHEAIMAIVATHKVELKD